MKRRLRCGPDRVVTAVARHRRRARRAPGLGGPDARAAGPRRRVRDAHRAGAAHGARRRGGRSRARAGRTSSTRLVDAAAREVDARVTIVRARRPRARRLRRSPAPTLRALENHGDRPEVQERAAPASRRAPCATAPPWARTCSTRRSPIRDEGRLVGVARLAPRASTGVAEQARELRRTACDRGPARLRVTALAVGCCSRPRSARPAQRDHGRRAPVRRPATSTRASACARDGRARRAGAHPQPLGRRAAAAARPRSRATAPAPTPSCPRWRTACSRSTTRASCCSPTTR